MNASEVVELYNSVQDAKAKYKTLLHEFELLFDPFIENRGDSDRLKDSEISYDDNNDQFIISMQFQNRFGYGFDEYEDIMEIPAYLFERTDPVRAYEEWLEEKINDTNNKVETEFDLYKKLKAKYEPNPLEAAGELAKQLNIKLS
jgi:hypothetical protein